LLHIVPFVAEESRIIPSFFFRFTYSFDPSLGLFLGLTGERDEFVRQSTQTGAARQEITAFTRQRNSLKPLSLTDIISISIY
jgi:hypothetical protein